MPPSNRTTITATQRLQLNLSLAASIRVLRHDVSGLVLYLEEQAAQNPHLKLGPPEAPAGEWLPRWSRLFAGADPGDTVASAGPSLIAHVMGEIWRLFPPGPDRQVAVVIAQALEPSGWLGRPLDELAREAGVAVTEAERVLRRLQGIDPAGLFARGLAECLHLQLAEAGWLDAPMQTILSRLDLLAAGDLARLARIAGVDEAAIALRQRRIRGLNPKPGAQFDDGAAPVREPDLLVRREGGRWVVALNRSALPALAVDPEAPGGSSDRLAAAREVVRQVEARGATILRVGQAVLMRQGDTLDRGMAALRPMTMADLAGDLGLHVSTVSRAVSGASVDTPDGTYWLRSFFSQGVRQRAGGGEPGPAGGALRAELARLVAAEDPAAPLSDAALAAALAETFGPPLLARRTVAKYRAMLSVPPAHRRRRHG